MWEEKVLIRKDTGDSQRQVVLVKGGETFVKVDP